MTLRPEYRLGHSEYNGFLFAAVGEDKTGQSLTMLSALSRLGIDPWQEAARLSDLPREVAARAIAATIARLPEGGWKASDIEAIGDRLVEHLPPHSVPPVPPTAVGQARNEAKEPKSKVSAWLVWTALFVAALLVTQYLQPDRNLEPPRAVETTRQ